MQALEEKNIIALKANAQRLRYIAEMEKKKAIEETIKEMEAKFSVLLTDLYTEFELDLKKALEEQKKQLDIEKETAVFKGKLLMKDLMQKKVDDIIRITVTTLIAEYATILEEHSQKWHEHFKYHLKLAEEHLQTSLQEEKQRFEQEKKVLHTDLQCEFIATIMYVMCSERRRCQCEKIELTEQYNAKILNLEDILKETTQKLETVTKETEEKNKKLENVEAALYNVIKEFQKFIYFVLRAEPKQAEYLLDIEKLMVFELTQTCMEKRPELFEGHSLWDLTRHSSATTSTKVESSEPSVSIETQDLLKIKDYHDTDNIHRVDPSVHTLSSSEDLPGFVYDEHIFVREDFRNMISQGLRISRSNHYWNWDIDDLTKLLSKDHTICFKSSDLDKFPCAQIRDDICPTKSDHFFPKQQKTKFYETCLGPCDKEEAKIPLPCDDRVCDLTCIKELRELPCDFTCEDVEEKKSVTTIKLDVIPEIDHEPRPSREKSFSMFNTCEECKLFRMGTVNLNEEVVCDCYPKLETPLQKLAAISGQLSLKGHSKSELDVTDDDTDVNTDVPGHKHIPLHFAENSQLILRHKSKLRKLETFQREKEKKKRSKIIETKTEAVALKGSIPSLIEKPVKSRSKLSLTKDSLLLIRSTSALKTIRQSQELKTQMAKSQEIYTGSVSSDSLVGDSSLENFNNYLEKLQYFKTKGMYATDKAVKISHFQPIPDTKGERVIFRDGLPKIIPRRWSDLQKSKSPIKEEGSLDTLPETLRDERIVNFVKNISSDPGLRQLFLGTR